MSKTFTKIYNFEIYFIFLEKNLIEKNYAKN